MKNNSTPDIIGDLTARGILNQCTDTAAISKETTKGGVVAYAGFDATADSLHVGHLIVLSVIKRWVEAGNKAIILIGSGTTRVGDPSFRNSARPMLSSDEVTKNASGIRKCIETVLSDNLDHIVFADNSEWLNEQGFIEFMCNIGQHFTAARMLSMDAVKDRISDGLTMLEMSYMMLQSFDFVELSRRHGCTVQIGGSDQWGNIVNGIDLARRMDGTQLFGLTVPLLTSSNGNKMGKTASGAVWLDQRKTSNSDFWQFWRNVSDRDVFRFLKQLTSVDDDQIASLEDAPDRVNEAKILLANEVTALARGREAAREAKNMAKQMRGETTERPVSPPEEIVIEGSEIGLLSLLGKLGWTSSNNEARRLVKGGAVRIDGDVITEERFSVTANAEGFLLRMGKSKMAFLAVKATNHPAPGL